MLELVLEGYLFIENELRFRISSKFDKPNLASMWNYSLTIFMFSLFLILTIFPSSLL